LSALDERHGLEHQLVYRQPVAWVLAGAVARSFEVLDAACADLGDRIDAAATEFRSFVAAFRDKFGVSPSD
jgi:hypothetical protein